MSRVGLDVSIGVGVAVNLKTPLPLVSGRDTPITTGKLLYSPGSSL
jgi:hypothetical protein